PAERRTQVGRGELPDEPPRAGLPEPVHVVVAFREDKLAVRTERRVADLPGREIRRLPRQARDGVPQTHTPFVGVRPEGFAVGAKAEGDGLALEANGLATGLPGVRGP